MQLLILETEATQNTAAMRYLYAVEGEVISVYERVYDNFGVASWRFRRQALEADLVFIIRHLVSKHDLKKSFQNIDKTDKK